MTDHMQGRAPEHQAANETINEIVWLALIGMFVLAGAISAGYALVEVVLEWWAG